MLLLLLLPAALVLADPALRHPALRVRRARAGSGRLPPLLLSLPSQVEEEYVLAPAASEAVGAPGGYLAPSETVAAPSSYLPPPSDPATGPACIVEEVVEVERVEEVQCVQMTRCRQVVTCRVEVRNLCANVTVEEEVEQCVPVAEQVCDDVASNSIEECKVVTEEKCEEEYTVEYKEECSYETVEDQVCSAGYSVSYSDECVTRQLPGVPRPVRLCRKVPQFPVNTCRLVARQVPRCRQVPVRRPACRQVERQVCGQAAAQPVCRVAIRDKCTTTTVPREEERCGEEEQEQCTDGEEECLPPTEQCRTVQVERPKTVLREVCEEEEEGGYSEPESALSSYLGPGAGYGLV